jgi:hypothetical protein
MFGMALRGYLRKVQRLRESTTDRGRSLWEAIYTFLRSERVTTRKRVLERFDRDDASVVRGVLHDLTDSGLIFRAGSGPSTAYRVATEDELGDMAQDPNVDDLLWVLIYREGPLDRDAIADRISLRADALDAALERLVSRGDVSRQQVGDAAAQRFFARQLLVPLEATTGWEASVFDHYHALVQTICRKLNQDPRASRSDTTGGSTYTFDVWAGHPYEERALAILRRFREEQSELRGLIQQHNDEHPYRGYGRQPGPQRWRTGNGDARWAVRFVSANRDACMLRARWLSADHVRERNRRRARRNLDDVVQTSRISPSALDSRAASWRGSKGLRSWGSSRRFARCATRPTRCEQRVVPALQSHLTLRITPDTARVSRTPIVADQRRAQNNASPLQRLAGAVEELDDALRSLRW